MFDTYVTIVGNVLTAPEWRRTTQSNTLVANFKVASTARRLDRETGRWVDGNSLRVRVNCWRKLAEGVASSVMVGDPVVVVGRMYTRDWTDGEGNHRTMYELEAVAVGHDLSRGRGRFVRNRPSMATSEVEDSESEQRVHGETVEPVPASDVPVRRGDNDHLFDDGDPHFREVPIYPPAETASTPGAGESTDDDDLSEFSEPGEDVASAADLDDLVDDEQPAAEQTADGTRLEETGSRGRGRRGRTPVPA